ncbi:hypothetical protein [Natronosalvus rutilus]|uniref:Uncharacterized protein n=1 Tax=Natronosalvus rutilus TaxID=2953753 RepID=A0A9E7NFP4_9EURY|nr:hypothetical protein [Natronosalvus rutilus]UTF55968.1 hypothetical protein NGM29_20975 [Natronosalvus rutilus]
MSETATPGSGPPDHRKHADWVAITNCHGTQRRIHKVKGNPGPGEIQNGDEVEVACKTSLVGSESSWKAKPAAVFPPGYHPLCDCPECFGEEIGETDGDGRGQGQDQ